MGAPASKESAFPRIVCWIDDLEQNNYNIIKDLEPLRITVKKFPTTKLFIRYYQEHLVNRSDFSTLRIITDMSRKEDDVVRKTAGFSVVKKLRKQNYHHPILIYQGKKSVQRTIDMINNYNEQAEPNKKLGTVLVESDLEKAFQYASFSMKDDKNNPVSMTKDQYDNYKEKFHRRVTEKHYLMRQKDRMGWKQIQKLPNLNLKKWDGIRERLPEIDKEWHCLLIRELRHHNQFWQDEMYFEHMEKLKEVPLGNLPLYCAIAVRLYTGPKLYEHFRDDLKAGIFKNWTYFTAAIETALYFLPPFKGTVWRGTNSLDVLPFHHDMMKNTDFVYVMIGVTSTSSEEDVALAKFANKRTDNPNPTLYELKINKGCDISHLSVHPQEKEILLPIFSCWRVIENEMCCDDELPRLVNRVSAEQIEEYELDMENFEVQRIVEKKVIKKEPKKRGKKRPKSEKKMGEMKMSCYDQ